MLVINWLVGRSGRCHWFESKPTTRIPADTTTATSTSPATSNAPDGRISLAELTTATLEVPAWPEGMLGHCPDQTVKMGAEAGLDDTPLRIAQQPIYVDVDQDGALETVMNLACSPQGSAEQVLAYDRDTAGRVYLLGKIVGTVGPAGRQGIGIMRVHGIAAASEGQVNVDVGEYVTCCGDNPDSPQHEWRTYGWDGNRFAQTGGRTAFGPNPKVADLAVTASNLVMVRQADGNWHGTLTLTTVTRGDHEAPVVLHLALPTQPTPSGTGWSGPVVPRGVAAPHGALAEHRKTALAAAGAGLREPGQGTATTVATDMTGSARPLLPPRVTWRQRTTPDRSVRLRSGGDLRVAAPGPRRAGSSVA